MRAAMVVVEARQANDLKPATEPLFTTSRRMHKAIHALVNALASAPAKALDSVLARALAKTLVSVPAKTLVTVLAA